MSWEERLINAVYVSPSGERFPFIYTDVSKQFSKKTSAFDFPDADGTYIQDFGKTGRRYPLRVIFAGEDYDLQADAFENAIGERGTGILEHPIYGVINVVPFGSITREDKLVSSSNMATITVTFYETIGRIYPSDETDDANSIAAKIENLDAVKSEQFEQESDLVSVAKQAEATGEYTNLLDDAKSGLNKVASVTAGVKRQFDNIFNSINTGIDILIGEPLTLAAQTMQLIQAPARAAALISDRLEAYGNLLNTILGKDDATDTNEFVINELYAQAYIVSDCLSTLNADFLTKKDAVAAAEIILNAFDAYIVWREANYISTGLIDTGSAYQAMQDLVAQTEGFLITASFTLAQERIIELNRNRTVVDLAAEVYPDRTDGIDFLISSNNLTGSQILELLRGTKVAYYV